jgi:hypothetical protein
MFRQSMAGLEPVRRHGAEQHTLPQPLLQSEQNRDAKKYVS